MTEGELYGLGWRMFDGTYPKDNRRHLSHAYHAGFEAASVLTHERDRQINRLYNYIVELESTLKRARTQKNL
jgi:hypothetical protein